MRLVQLNKIKILLSWREVKTTPSQKDGQFGSRRTDLIVLWTIVRKLLN